MNKKLEDRLGEDSKKQHNLIMGTCLEMCPAKERILREREGLLHKLECLEVSTTSWPVEESTNIGVVKDTSRGQRKQYRGDNSFGPRKPLPKADINKIIKSFARSAAGQDKTLPEDLRPVHVLKKTVAYLCIDALRSTEYPFNFVYDFVFDRLRAVRQDLVIQRIEDRDAILILETIVKFHIYSEYRLREESLTNYDPHINQKHLIDCLRKLIGLYQINNYWESSRAEFEALHCIIFPGSYDVITRAISLKKEIKSDILNSAIDMALAYQSRNFVRFFRRISDLPTALQMYSIRHTSLMRSLSYQVYAMAYGVNTCKVPLIMIAEQLGYRSSTNVHRDLSHMAVEVLRDSHNPAIKYAKFLKSNRQEIESKASSVSSEMNSPALDALRTDKSHKLASKLVCSW